MARSVAGVCAEVRQSKHAGGRPTNSSISGYLRPGEQIKSAAKLNLASSALPPEACRAVPPECHDTCGIRGGVPAERGTPVEIPARPQPSGSSDSYISAAHLSPSPGAAANRMGGSSDSSQAVPILAILAGRHTLNAFLLTVFKADEIVRPDRCADTASICTWRRGLRPTRRSP